MTKLQCETTLKTQFEYMFIINIRVHNKLGVMSYFPLRVYFNGTNYLRFVFFGKLREKLKYTTT